MSMSKKQYNAIAQRYHEIYIKEYDIHDVTVSMSKVSEGSKYVGKRVFDDMVSALADVLEGDNDAFDRERFMCAVYHD